MESKVELLLNRTMSNVRNVSNRSVERLTPRACMQHYKKIALSWVIFLGFLEKVLEQLYLKTTEDDCI